MPVTFSPTRMLTAALPAMLFPPKMRRVSWSAAIANQRSHSISDEGVRHKKIPLEAIPVLAVAEQFLGDLSLGSVAEEPGLLVGDPEGTEIGDDGREQFLARSTPSGTSSSRVPIIGLVFVTQLFARTDAGGSERDRSATAGFRSQPVANSGRFLVACTRARWCVEPSIRGS